MAKQLIPLEDEMARKAGAIRSLSLGWLIAAAAGGIAVSIIGLFVPDIPVVPSVAVAGAVVLYSLITYLLNKFGRVLFAGYFFVICVTLAGAIITLLFGGIVHTLAITFFLPILLAGIVIGMRASFIAAIIVTIVYLVVGLVELSGVFPQLILLEWDGEVFLYLTIVAYILFFYLVAFLGWFAARRLNRSLKDTRRYAAELQAANEKLQASEEELRASNEELEAANEELRATEEELRSSNEELEAANEELKQAQEQLIRSEKLAAIGQLAGGVGHELRNPLGAIKNAVYYIRGKAGKSDLAQKEPRVMEFLDIVDDEINASNRIINDLLGFSRVGKPAVSPARIEMVIDDAIAHTSIPENIELNKKVDAKLPEVGIDTDQIRQVLVNMITNAVQAMPEGGKLTLEARKKDSFLEMKIADTGVGMSEETMGKIFDPLFTTRAKGIGLGLAVCKSIIDRHEGQVKVESSVGKGTTFTIRLPLNTG